MRIVLVVCGLMSMVIGLASLGATASGAPATSAAGAASDRRPADRSAKNGVPCTKRALEAAMRRAGTHARIATKHAFGCAGGFAYAFAIAGRGTTGFEENLLFKGSGRRWKVVSRAKYCKKRAVPARIKKAVCFSS